MGDNGKESAKIGTHSSGSNILSRIPRLCGSVTNNSTWIRIGYRARNSTGVVSVSMELFDHGYVVTTRKDI
jgi:hypothetical protein